jgi:hypothetical protein
VRKRFVAVGIALGGAITAIALAAVVVVVRGNTTTTVPLYRGRRGRRDPSPAGTQRRLGLAVYRQLLLDVGVPIG